MSDVPNITQNFARPSYRPAVTAGGLDPDMRRMAIVAAGFGGALALVIAAFSPSHRVHHGVPVILADTRPVRIKPLHPGGMQVAGAEDIATGAERLAPAPEKPALHALHARAHPPRAAEKPAPAAIAPQPVPPAPAAKGTTVQLAAFSTQQAAEQGWGKLAEHIPNLLNNHRPEVERAQASGHTVYRLRTGGFPTIAAATEFCGKVRAKGGECAIAAS